MAIERQSFTNSYNVDDIAFSSRRIAAVHADEIAGSERRFTVAFTSELHKTKQVAAKDSQWQ